MIMSPYMDCFQNHSQIYSQYSIQLHIQSIHNITIKS